MNGSSIVRSDDLRNENRRRVLDTLRLAGASSPASLGELTGLSAASISSLSSQMADQGIIQSSRPKVQSNGGRGRPQSLIDLSSSAGDIITLSLTLDLIHVQRVNYAGELLHCNTREIQSREIGESELLNTCQSAISQMMQCSTGSPVQRIGVAYQGITENNNGVLAWSPIIQHRNVNLGAFLHSSFNLPVSVNNDCRLIAEALSKSSRQLLGSSFATVLFSQGVGLGLYIDGKPFSGMRSSALELGHLRFERNGALCRCGRRGCIEAYAADYGIQRMVMGHDINDEPIGRVNAGQISKLCDAATANDKPAMQAFAIAGAAVGEGLSALFTLLDPMPVALVGRSKDCFALMRSGISSVFRNQPDATVNIDELLHCFEDAEPLLQNGLINNTLSLLDHQFAYLTHTSFNTAPAQ